ncbi:MAG: hypothetical protein ACI9MB_002301, partial [Verrucomicrobiales bacterium]
YPFKKERRAAFRWWISQEANTHPATLIKAVGR